MQLNRKKKDGSWVLTGEYLAYKRDGGRLSPSAWNERKKKLR